MTNPAEGATPRIVCAANRHKATGEIAIGIRHFCPIMHGNIRRFRVQSDPDYMNGWRQSEQGFIDQHGTFYTREQAWAIAEKNGQIIRDAEWQKGHLHSEHLY